MSDTYNPEADLIERIGQLEVESQELVRRRDAAADPTDRQTLDQQLHDVEGRIRRLKARLRAGVSA